MEHLDISSQGKSLSNILVILSMLEKEMERIARRNYHSPTQYPEIFFEIEFTIKRIRSWIKIHMAFCGVSILIDMLSGLLKKISMLVSDLVIECIPVKGKKKVSKIRLIRERKRIENSVNNMLGHIEKYLAELNPSGTEIEAGLEEALLQAFERHFSGTDKIRFCVSGRGEKTFVFPWSDKKDYQSLVQNKKRIRSEVVDQLEQYPCTEGHKPGCKCSGRYQLKGFRSNERKVVMEGGKQESFPIRMIECSDCKQRFSLLPSFLPREKHFGIDIIGNIIRSIVLFGQSLQGASESFQLTGARLKSKQTILNWVRWFGTFHPAEILTRAGIKGSGYFQEDEGFEKESGMRTYTVTMVEPETLLVWHLDYVDFVDTETLTESFEKFAERINFKVLGVTKDKWKPSTDALKNTFHRIWVGFCHLHCRKKFRKALSEYQKQTQCSSKETGKLYKKFKKALSGATSETNLKIRIRNLKEEEFNHPLLRRILDQVIKDGAHYTCHKRRSGIKKTTSIADNFLKIVKRKLKQVESFRDKEYAAILFRAMANIRNFVPFMSSAKNAHKSPFMIAQGETFELPWAQVMNVHNAFLFTENTV